MKKKELLVPLFLKNGEAVTDRKNRKLLSDGDAAALAQQYDNRGADGIVLFDLSEGDAEHDLSISTIKKIAKRVDIPVYAGGNIRRTEDVKKLLYAGCRKIFLNFSKEGNRSLTREVSERFGREKILACVTANEFDQLKDYQEYLGGLIWLDAKASVLNGEACFCEKQTTEGESAEKKEPSGEAAGADTDPGCVILCLDECGKKELIRTLGHPSVSGVSMRALTDNADSDDRENLSGPAKSGGEAGIVRQPVFCDFMEIKHELKDAGIPVNTYEASLSWTDFRTGDNGLLPVVVQDYRTQEVLMVAYMNREAFETTVRTGRMTYWSRSRKELWVKGMTSGHFQYVRELLIDCDNDTLLARVLQIGAACHTGNRSCFYRSILKKEYDETNPLKVFEDVFGVILDRKEHPKKGSYTNYLFDKGIDKILKKVGEEATEIVIAAKNPDPEEIKYEISDFLYHVMVLMAEKGVNWEDITEELARR